MPSALMLCYTFPPACGGGVPRSAKFVRYLPNFSWRPVVLCQEPEPTAHRDDGPLADLPEDVCVRRIPSTTCDGLAWRLHGRMESCLAHILPRPLAEKLASTSCTLASKLIEPFYRPDYAIGFLRSGLRLAVDMARRHNVSVIYASSPPASILLMGLAVKRLTGLPLVCDLRDPIVGHNEFHVLPGWWRKARRLCERKVVAGADRIISAVDTATEDLFARFPHAHAEQFVTIPNGYDPADFVAPSSAGDRMLRIVHTGGLYGNRRMGGLLRAIAELIERHPELGSRIRVDHFGPQAPDGATELIERLAGVLHWHGPRPHAEVVAAMQTADVLLLMVMPNTRFSVPGKAYEYIGARRPILLLGPAESPAGRLLSRLDAGWILDPEDRDGLTRWLTDMLTLRDSGPLAAPPETDLSPWQRPVQAARLAEVLDDLIRRPAPQRQWMEPAYA